MQTFDYGEKELNYLSTRDERLAKVIEEVGKIERKINPDLFQALVHNVIGQQISNKAAATVLGRFLDCVKTLNPLTIVEKEVEDLQKCGISFKKIGYIKGIANAVLTGDLDLNKLPKMEDNEVIKKLSALDGIGVWTAEMLLIFSMQRKDVLSWGDLGIKRGMMNLYGLETLSKKEFMEYKKIYSPYASVASFYLWTL